MSRRTVVENEMQAIWDARGRLVPGDVVEVAADEAHPLHGFFEWDDTAAAHKFRVSQAASLIRSVKITVTTERAGELDDLKVRAWLPARAAGVADSTEGYMPESYIRQNPEMREALLRQMLRDLHVFRRRYQHLAEFWNTVEELVSQKAVS